MTVLEREPIAAPHGVAGRAARRRALAAPMLVCVVLLVVASARLDAPFSSSFDGTNSAVWASGSRLVRDHGWVDSRLGAGIPIDEGGAAVPYAHHPPLVRVQVVASEALFGEHRWATRLPALLSSLAAVWLCWGWLGSLGFGSRSRSVGVLVMGGTTMLLTYGLSLNMEAAWLPFAFGLLWCWQRSPGRRGVALLAGLLALLGAFAAHEGILLAGALGALGLADAARHRRRPQAHEVAVAVAAVLGAVAFFAWVGWAADGFDDLIRIGRTRTGGGTTWAAWATAQVRYSFGVFGVLGVVCLVVGPFLVRARPAAVRPMVAIWGVGVTYAVLFRHGAEIHPYWNAALLPATVLGAALLSERATAHGRSAARLLMAMCLLSLGIGAARAIAVGGEVDGLGRLARAAVDLPGELYTTELAGAWLRYESGRADVATVLSCEALVRLSESDPDALVLTHRRWEPWQRPDAWRRATSAPSVIRDGPAALGRAGDLAGGCR